MYENKENIEIALAVSVVKKGTDRKIVKDHLDELAFLADTAGAEVVETIVQELPKPNKTFAVGKGKVEEIKDIVKELSINLVIFDDDLSPAQVRNLERALEVKVIDRSGLILDIFAHRAQTVEAKTQVELAQLQYLLPRLTRMWTHLSKQYGGIGTKGPGETQIETDRRIVRYRIQKLKEKLEVIDTQKEQQRKGRDQLPRFALVGYTNAGKSTLMRLLTEADVYVEDKLFATLDTTVRTFELPKGNKALLSDTVGFIRKLPTHLVASFRSTLAEASEADIILHAVDISHEHFRDHIAVVNETLKQLNIVDKPTILILNKLDLLEDQDEIRAIQEEFPNSILVSATRNINISSLLGLMQAKYDERAREEEILLPYTEMQKVADLYKLTEVEERIDKDTGIFFKVRIPNEKEEIFDHSFSNFIM